MQSTGSDNEVKMYYAGIVWGINIGRSGSSGFDGDGCQVVSFLDGFKDSDYFTSIVVDVSIGRNVIFGKFDVASLVMGEFEGNVAAMI